MRVRTKQTLCHPDIATLILRGAWKCGFPHPAGVMSELLKRPDSDSCGIFIGFHGGKPVFVVVGQLPTNYLTIAAGVHLAYSERAPRQIVADTCGAMREWFRREGYTYVMVANLLHTDRSYIRGFAHFGKGSRVGGVIRFDF